MCVFSVGVWWCLWVWVGVVLACGGVSVLVCVVFWVDDVCGWV